MTTGEVMRLAARRGLRFDLEDGRVSVHGSNKALAELAEVLRLHRDEIKALLEEFVTPANASDPASAANLLRYGLWPPTKPEDCNFHIGAPGNDCRRCGATWHFHVEKAAGRVAAGTPRRSSLRPRIGEK